MPFWRTSKMVFLAMWLLKFGSSSFKREACPMRTFCSFKMKCRNCAPPRTTIRWYWPRFWTQYILRHTRRSLHAWCMGHVVHIFSTHNAWSNVATLALGSWPKQGFARLRAKREAGSCTKYSQKCEKVWGNEPPHPKGVPLWELESRWTPKSSRGDLKG